MKVCSTASLRRAACSLFSWQFPLLAFSPDVLNRIRPTHATLLRTQQPLSKCRPPSWPVIPTDAWVRSEEHTSELQSLMRISYAVFCLKKKNNRIHKRIAYTQTY